MTITVRFSAGSGWEGAVVRYATWSPWAHVGFKLDSGKVLDCTPQHGVAVRDAQDDPTTEYWAIDCPDPRIPEQAAAWLMTQVGKPYDWSAIFGMAVRRDWHCDTAWFCSEGLAAAFEHGPQWPLVWSSRRVNRLSPRDIALSTRLIPPANTAVV